MPYSWIAAGYIPEYITRAQVYVRWKKTGIHGLETEDHIKDRGYTFIRLPDREMRIYVPKPAWSLHPTYDDQTKDGDRWGWDQVWNSDFLGDSFGESLLDFVLISAQNGMEYNHMAPGGLRERETWHRNGVKLVGDCVVGSTLLCTNKGVVPIEDLGKGAPLMGWHDLERLDVATSVGPSGFDRLFKTWHRTTFELSTKRGRKLKGSEKHKVLTKSFMGESYVKLSELKEGDQVAVSLGKNVWSETVPEFELPNEDFEALKGTDLVECKICSSKFEQLSSHLRFKHGLSGDDYLSKHPGSRMASRYTLKKKGNRSPKQTLPSSMTPELARLLGYIAGDGRIRKGKKNNWVQVHCGIDADYAEDVKRCFDECFPDMGATIVKELTGGMPHHPEAYGTEIYNVSMNRNSKRIIDFLESIGQKATTAEYKEVPWSVLQSPKNLVCEFLSGLFEADGYVSKTANHMEYYSVSVRMVEQVSCLLDNLGVMHTVIWLKRRWNPIKEEWIDRPAGKMTITGYGNIRAFKKHIGFISSRKRARIDGVKTSTTIRNKCHEPNRGIYWDTVTSVDRVQAKKALPLYDICVPSEHNYVANGLVTHNSGGFQLKIGTSDYVDPRAVITWYNQVVDVGLSLDVPPRPVDLNYPATMKALATVQRRHNELFMVHKRDDLELLNCVQGSTEIQIRNWCKRVRTPGFKGWATGAGNPHSYLSALGAASLPYLEFGGEHIHVLGVGGRKKLPGLAWLGRHMPMVTSDSTAWLQAAQNRVAHIQQMNGSIKALRIGDIKDKGMMSMMPIPCSCPACSIAGVWDTFAVGLGVVLMLWHNLYTHAKHAKFWSNLAMQSESAGDFIESANLAFSNRSDRSLVRLSTGYVECAFTEGLKEATKKYKKYLVATNQGQFRSIFKDSDEEELSKSYFQLPSTTIKCLPNYMTLEEMKRIGIKTEGIEPGRADGSEKKYKIKRRKKRKFDGRDREEEKKLKKETERLKRNAKKEGTTSPKAISDVLEDSLDKERSTSAVHPESPPIETPGLISQPAEVPLELPDIGVYRDRASPKGSSKRGLVRSSKKGQNYLFVKEQLPDKKGKTRNCTGPKQVGGLAVSSTTPCET